MTLSTISPTDLAKARADGAVVIDVRSPGEYAGVHIEGSTLVPLDRFDPATLSIAIGESQQTIYLLCGSGIRSRQAAERFGVASRLTPVVIDGGITAWINAGLPVVRGRGAISLERQVRIVAGSLVAIGVALGVWVHPGFLALAGFVGLGLVFAGITDFCGMALILARLPWNSRVPAAPNPTQTSPT